MWLVTTLVDHREDLLDKVKFKQVQNNGKPDMQK